MQIQNIRINISTSSTYSPWNVFLLHHDSHTEQRKTSQEDERREWQTFLFPFLQSCELYCLQKLMLFKKRFSMFLFSEFMFTRDISANMILCWLSALVSRANARLLLMIYSGKWTNDDKKRRKRNVINIVMFYHKVTSNAPKLISLCQCSKLSQESEQLLNGEKSDIKQKFRVFEFNSSL